jgi:WD40 repeat protein
LCLIHDHRNGTTKHLRIAKKEGEKIYIRSRFVSGNIRLTSFSLELSQFLFYMGSAGSKRQGGRNQNWLIQTLDNHESAINCMALSNDSSVIATGSDDNTIRLWSTKTKSVEYLSVLSGHTDYITQVLIYENYLFSASADKTVRKWDMPSGKCLFVCTGHTSLVNRIVCTGN